MEFHHQNPAARRALARHCRHSAGHTDSAVEAGIEAIVVGLAVPAADSAEVGSRLVGLATDRPCYPASVDR